MKTKLISQGLLLSTVVLTAACSLHSNPNNGYHDPLVAYTAVQKQTDARILGGMIVLNKNEISLAQLAQQKTNNPAVRNYALWMEKAHSQNLNETLKLSQQLGLHPMEGDVARMLQQKGRQEMKTLSRLQNGAFDKAYIAAMVKGHQAALHLLDDKLIKLAVNPALKHQLENTSHHVNEHLQKAKAVQNTL